MVLYLFSFFQDHFFMVLFLICTEEERSGCRNRFSFNRATSEVQLFGAVDALAHLSCRRSSNSPARNVGLQKGKKYCDEISQTPPPHRPHEIWVCKKAKSIVIGFSGGIEGNYIGWTGGLISWRPMMGTSLFSSSSHFFMSQLCRIYVTHCSKCYNEIQILLFLL